ncbi:hypothetical protein Tco_0783728 [Tanacetum coccineum]
MYDSSPFHSHDLRTMEELHKPSLIRRGGPIVPRTVPRTVFVLKKHMVQLLRQNCQFYRFKDEDANKHLDKYLSITQFIKQNGVSQDIINLILFPFALTREAKSWLYHLKTNSIHTWKEMVFKFLSKYYPYSKWDAKVYYDPTTGVNAHYYETTSALSTQIESDEDEPSEADKSEIDPLIREPPNTFLMKDKEIALNPFEDGDELVPIPRISEKPLEPLDSISETFDMTVTNPLLL